MEMTDLKTAIDDYTDVAESGLMAMKDRLDMLETKMARPGAAGDSMGADVAEHKSAFFGGFIQRLFRRHLAAGGFFDSGGHILSNFGEISQ